jgi:hypothetical protein
MLVTRSSRFVLAACVSSLLFAPLLTGGELIRIQKMPAPQYATLSKSQIDALAARGVQVLEDYGPFAVATAAGGIDAAGVAEASVAVGLPVVVDTNAQRIDLAGFDIDASSTSAAPPLSAPKELMFSDYGGAIGLYIVQFHGPLLGPWLEALKSNGARPIQYVNSNAYIVAAPSGVDALRAKLKTPIRYVGVLQPAYKMSAGLRAKLSGEGVRVQVLLDAGQDLSDVIAVMKEIDSGLILTPVRQNERQATLFADAATRMRLVKRSEILWMEQFVVPTPSDERANQITAGNIDNDSPATSPRYQTWLETNGLSHLEDEVVDIMDTGLQVDSYGVDACVDGSTLTGGHADLNNASNVGRLKYACPLGGVCKVRNIKDGYYHGTFVAGLIGGNPAQSGGSGLVDSTGSFYWGMGVAPTVKFGYTKLLGDDGSICGSPVWAGFASHAFSQGAGYQNNSWNDSDPLDVTYSLRARDYDTIVRDAFGGDGTSLGSHPITVIFSAGNVTGGDLRVQSPATAKNVITVGSSALARGAAFGGELGGSCDQSLAINDVTAFSVRGTTMWNRFKPDLVAPGQTLTSAFSSYSQRQDCSGAPVALSGTNGNYYPATGTSFSAPLVTGAAVLVHKRVWNLSGGTVSAPPSLLKAALVGSAGTMQGGVDRATGLALGWEPRGAQGWGRLDLARVFDATPKIWGPEDSSNRTFTATGAYQNFVFSVADPSKPLIVALAWTDAHGQAGASSPIVNNLNMYVMQGNSVYCDGQYSGQYSTPTNGCWPPPDATNNVKVLRIAPFSFSGQFMLQIVAGAINGHAVPGVGGPSQDYSVFVYNAQ